MPLWAQAGLWGLLAGSALVLGAALAHLLDLPHRLIAAVMGFGGGVLVALLSVDLIEEAYAAGGLPATVLGVFAGATVFSAANWGLARYGAAHRKRCGRCVQQATEAGVPGSGLAIALGALLDGIPEALVIGLSVLGGGVSLVAVAGFFLANVPEGLSSASGMKQAGRPVGYIFGVWGGIAAVSGAAAVLGATLFGRLPPEAVAATGAVAAGSILAMLAETMIPEAFERAQAFIGLITVAGFLAAFLLTKLGGP
jgi:ZIP family zinc transporter